MQKKCNKNLKNIKNIKKYDKTISIIILNC